MARNDACENLNVTFSKGSVRVQERREFAPTSPSPDFGLESLYLISLKVSLLFIFIPAFSLSNTHSQTHPPFLDISIPFISRTFTTTENTTFMILFIKSKAKKGVERGSEADFFFFPTFHFRRITLFSQFFPHRTLPSPLRT